ncbi:hypothetical protein N9777_08385 [Ascidiaceihabitans sp.]|nr:hypothetical protein [Ascidiaceihabitans sp.]
MTFSEHIASQEDLEERVLRTGAIVAYGSKSRREGDEAVRAYKHGQQALQKGGPEVDLEDRVKRIEQSLDHMFEGLIKQRAQIGSGVAVDVVGHSLSNKRTKT